MLEAAEATIEMLYLQELSSVYEQLAQQAEQTAVNQKERFKIAAEPYRSVVLAELSANEFELSRFETVVKLNQAKVRFTRAMGICDATLPPLEGRLTAAPVAFPPMQAVLAQAGCAASELAQAQAAIRESCGLHSFERWDAMPDISVGPRLMSDLAENTNEKMGARVQLDVPIFDRNQGNIAETAADIQTNRAKHDLLRVTALNDVASLYLELQVAQSRTEYYRTRIQPLMDQTEKSLRAAFEDRSVTAYELADLLKSLARMKLNDVELRHEHCRLRTRLELLLECPLSDLGGGELAPVPPESIRIPMPQDMPAEGLNP